MMTKEIALNTISQMPKFLEVPIARKIEMQKLRVVAR